MVAVEAITAPSDAFRCQPYRATLLAGTCVQRQARADEARAFGDSGERYDKKPMGDYGLCRGCELGALVAARLEGKAPAPRKLDGGRRHVGGRARRRSCSLCGAGDHDRRTCRKKSDGQAPRDA